MEDIYQRFSVRLYQILDAIGGSDDFRTSCWEDAMNQDILETIYNNGDVSVYRCGSTCEGTTTPGLHRDVDYLFCFENLLVVEKIEDAPEYGHVLLMITDADTMPGYFKLQCVYNKCPQTIYLREINAEYEDTDTQGRICLKHTDLRKLPFILERNGPAGTILGDKGIADIDNVKAFGCRNMHGTLNPWFNKQYTCNWPSKTQLYKMGSLGCFFVEVGHVKSKNKLIEWRISFSLQERELMSSLNPTQHKCYILLKMIKKDIIQPRTGDKSISSYHCKTCLFYVLEKSRPGLWTRRNLIQGVRVCLAVLLQWVKRGNCPNFLIPEENMFDKLDQETLDKVDRVLTDILKSGVRFLFSIKCDKVGSYLSEGSLVQIRHDISTMPKCLRYINLLSCHYTYRNIFLRRCGNIQLPELCLLKELYIFRNISSTNKLKHRSSTDVRTAVQSILPYIHLQISLSIASVMNCKEKEGTCSAEMVKSFEYCINESETCDLISSKLVLATCYLRADMLDKCEENLLMCETCLETFVMSLCSCRVRLSSNESLLKLLRSYSPSPTDFRRKCITGCMLFLPAQASLVHPSLQYEMYRSVFTPPGSRDERTEYWFDWILVDSRVYLYFLQYVLFSKTNKHLGKVDAINNMLQLVATDGNLVHRETAFNLLGWIFTQESNFGKALLCYRKSWRIQPVHNAAKWHLGVMLAAIYRQASSS